MNDPFEHLNSNLLTDEYINWIANFHLGRDDHGIRFGQYLCNVYLRDGKSFSELFHQENAHKAFCIAMRELDHGKQTIHTLTSV